VATATTVNYGSPISGLTGSVTGLIPNDPTVSGTASFTTTAGSTSPIGSYAINGSGLVDSNYTFVQAGSNATALTIVAVPVTCRSTGWAGRTTAHRMWRPAARAA